MTRITAAAFARVPFRQVAAAAIFFVVVLAYTVVAVRLASAHEFYPWECCSGIDCAPISADRVKPAPGGYMVDGQFMVPQAEVRYSPDGKYHACFPTPDKLKCFWAPVPSF